MMLLVERWEGDDALLKKRTETIIINTDQFIGAQPYQHMGQDFTQVIMTDHRFVTPISIMEFYRKLDADV